MKSSESEHPGEPARDSKSSAPLAPGITFREEGDRITLEMTQGDYEQLLIVLGYACGAASKESKPIFWEWMRFVNRLNATNPRFQPYEIPARTQAEGLPAKDAPFASLSKSEKE